MKKITALLTIAATIFTISGCNDDNQSVTTVTAPIPKDPIVGIWSITSPSLVTLVISKNHTAKIVANLEGKDYIGIVPDFVKENGQHIKRDITLRHYKSLPFGNQILDKISGKFTMDLTQLTPYVAATLDFDLASKTSSVHYKQRSENIPELTGYGPSDERVSFSDLDFNFPMSIDPEKVSFKHIGNGEIEVHDARFGNCRIHSKLVPTNANIFQGRSGMDWTHEFEISKENTNCNVGKGAYGILSIKKSPNYTGISLIAPLEDRLITLYGQVKLN